MDAAQLKRDIGDRLRLAREALGFTNAAAFARQHALDKTKLSHWERGKHYPDPIYVHLLWREYRITADWIYLGERGSLAHSTVENLLAAGRASQAAR
jgi:transcriptional regulator with XRE-family HTH domain